MYVDNYKGYSITVDADKVTASTPADFIVFSIRKLIRRTTKNINRLIMREIDSRIKYLSKQNK
jgi:hypothetical protein